MDEWCARHTGQAYDKDGRWAATGKTIPLLLEKLLALPFFSLPPPKSVSRELFSTTWLDGSLKGNESPADVQATLLELTVTGIARCILDYCGDAAEIYVCGGGARNSQLVASLQVALSGRKVGLTDSLGVDADWLEAFAFGWLARQVIHGMPGNIPSVTGAKGERLLGAIYPA
jgi:anhydro-N-acetylmuramic acid kinase